MKWLRRALAFLLVDLLIILLTLALAVWQINSTFLRSSFYSEILDESGVYGFLLVDLPTSALNELQSSATGDSSLRSRPLDALGIEPHEVVSSMNAALPVPWVQETVEHVISQLGGYVTGERDEFQVTVRFDDRVDALATEFKGLIVRSNTYDIVFDEFVAPLVSDAVVDWMPVELELTGEQILASVERIAPRDWVEPQFVAAVDEVTPYLIGKADSFEIVVPLDGRVEVGLQEMKVLLRASGAYEKFYDQLIDPLVYQSLGGGINLPYGIELDDQEIAAAIRDVAPPEWIQSEAEQIIDDTTPFLTGRADSFSSTVSLSEVKQRAVVVLQESVARELNEVVASLPDCNNIPLQQILAGGLQGTVECIPQDATVRQFTEILAEKIADIASVSIVAVIPESIVFTEQDLYDTLSLAGVEDGSSAIDAVRDRVRSGWSYTDEDFVVDLGELAFNEVDGRKASENINRVRAFMSDGWTFDEDDYEAYLNSEYPSVAPMLETARVYLKRARMLGFLVFIPVLLLVIAIAFTGGRSWSGRFTWAFGSLSAASFVVLVMFGVVYGLIVGSMLDGLQDRILADAASDESFGATKVLLANKVIGIIRSVYDDFSSGIISRALLILALSIFGLIVTLSWDYIVQLGHRLPLESDYVARLRRRFHLRLDLDRIRRR